MPCHTIRAYPLHIILFKNETCIAEVALRSPIKGIALIELLIVVILISTVATAIWNFYIASDHFNRTEVDITSPSDSLANAILDEMALNLRHARPDSNGFKNSITIRNSPLSDTIEISKGSTCQSYYVDNNHVLVLRIGEHTGKLLSDVKSLKVTGIGSHNLLLTISLDTFSRETDSTSKALNYFKVAAVNLLPGFSGQGENRD
jgi:hypothetical protein